MYNKQKRNRNYQIKKSSIKDEIIDKQILAIHRVMVDKIVSTPSLVGAIVDTIEERKEQGKIGYGEYITWISLMELVDTPEEFKQGVLEPSVKMKRLRRKTPFTGILTEEEREIALQTNSAGSTNNIDYLFS